MLFRREQLLRLWSNFVGPHFEVFSGLVAPRLDVSAGLVEFLLNALSLRRGKGV